MTWITPKTDWTVTDYFNCEDYNRIKNNANCLEENGLCSEIADKVNGDFLCYEDITDILSDLNDTAVRLCIKNTLPVWDNSSYLDYVALNNIESFEAKLKDYDDNQRNDNRMLPYMLGTEGEF